MPAIVPWTWPAAWLLATSLSIAVLSAVSIARAQDATVPVAAASSSAQAAPANSSDSAQSANSASSGATDNAATSGQMLEVPAATPPSASPSSDNGSALGESTWSDGTHTYVWKDEGAGGDDGGDASVPAPDSSLPEPVYASLDDYMNEGREAEALGPAFSPFFGSPMPLFVTGSYLYSPYYSPYGYYRPPVVPAPLPPPPRHRRQPSFVDAGHMNLGTATGPPSIGMGGFGHASRMH